jgi:hypothetical protein
MLLAFAVAGALAVASPDTVPPPAPPVGPRDVPVGIGAPRVADDTTPARRRKAVEISDAYATRLKIHYIASFATIPIFAAQAVVGEQLYHAEQNGYPPSHSLRDTHDAIAVALGALFVTNGVTGSMNWWETRHSPAGRPWRTVHAALMLLSEAGFAYTASLGERARINAPTGTNSARDLHRRWAEISAGTALAGYIMMWKPIRGDH